MKDLTEKNNNEEKSIIDLMLNNLFGVMDITTPGFEMMRTSLFGALDIEETEDGYVCVCDLPGFAKEDVSITLKDDVLTIEAEKESDENQEGKNYKVQERFVRKFRRSIELENKVVKESIEAELEDGVLRITADKPKEDIDKDKPHNIVIK